MAKITTAGHRLTNGDALRSFLRELGRPSSSAPAFAPFKFRKDSKSAISGLPGASTLPSSLDTSTSSIEKSSKISFPPSSRDSPIFHQLKESSQSKDRSALDAPTCQEKEKTDVLWLLACSYVSDSDSSKSGSTTIHLSLPLPAQCQPLFSLPSEILPSLPRQNSDKDLLSISNKTNSISSPCPHRHSAPVDRSYLSGSPNSWLHQKIRACGEAIGISVDNSKEGWDSLITFAKDRDSTLGTPITYQKK
ncbi:hypothetical protein AAC387_Pa08g1342 [Persea americana]